MSNIIRERFGRKLVLPVVHCVSARQALIQFDLAVEVGADGAFFINQGGLPAGRVAQVAGHAKEACPNVMVGINLLGYDHMVAQCAAHHVLDAVWSDLGDIPKSAKDDEGVERSWLFFGGVAFKYQPVTTDLRRAVVDAVSAGVDVVTTSGDATGQPPTVEKIVEVRAAAGDHAVAVASGITPENVGLFVPYVDAFLVATGVERSFGDFDPHRLRDLSQAVRSAGS